MIDSLARLGSACGSIAIASVLVACGGGSAADARYPKRPDGCEVALYPQTPEVATDNIGPVHASCSEDVAPEDCVRTLKDQVCKLGGDVVWGVEEPEKRDGHFHYNGRAAHTKKARR